MSNGLNKLEKKRAKCCIVFLRLNNSANLMQSPHIKKHNFHFLTQSPHFSITARREIALPLRPGAAPGAAPPVYRNPLALLASLSPFLRRPCITSAPPPHCAARAAIFLRFSIFFAHCVIFFKFFLWCLKFTSYICGC